MTPFARSAAGVLATAVLLLAVERAHPANGSSRVPRAVAVAVEQLVYHGANEEDENGLLAGYYEELLNASRDARPGGRLDEQWGRAFRMGDGLVPTRDFLLYRMRPRFGDARDPAASLVTNGEGMADRDYPLERTPGVRRIAWIGDSLSRGLGAPFGRSLEPRLEEWLNAEQRGGGVAGFEVLNFAVEGYRLSQFVAVVDEVVPRWKPDVVVVGLSDLSVARIFGHHVARLVHDGIDLRYPFLVELAARARLLPDDSPKVTDGKLAPFRREFVAWALRTIRDRAVAGGARTLALLVPAVGDARRVDDRFAEARAIARELALPTVDLVSTFAGVADLAPLRVSEVDHHPNEAGHGLLLARFESELARDPALLALLRGDRPAADGPR